jgi:hypothetical protein
MQTVRFASGFSRVNSQSIDKSCIRQMSESTKKANRTQKAPTGMIFANRCLLHLLGAVVSSPQAPLGIILGPDLGEQSSSWGSILKLYTVNWRVLSIDSLV